MSEFTQTEAAMMDVLSDGNRHTKEELHGCLPDELGSTNNIKVHISNMRKKLQPSGRDIVCISRGYRRSVLYQLVQLLYVTTE